MQYEASKSTLLEAYIFLSYNFLKNQHCTNFIIYFSLDLFPDHANFVSIKFI